LKHGRIFFAVNFDPKDDTLVKNIREKIDNTFINYQEDFDLLSYLD
jgi:hypothetical protein